eukprot:CAMPEP_0118937232 /NCGR_PEP_ID=MMETSP1169-20130426/22060_1 /TAXON_ID=36882 /ORGANISM="Pyramimonas obovata, Strain CCMP722" /LENGTH=222 /DNA_ID=CAMNT_0006880809 /DNA_START=122 /DNA_END=786 /DNA_ORIENTATION=-
MGADSEIPKTGHDGVQLMIELERLFQCDPHIDEVALLPSTDCLAGGEQVSILAVEDTFQSCIPSAFFLAEHKLAVALPVVKPLYKAADGILQSYLLALQQPCDSGVVDMNQVRCEHLVSRDPVLPLDVPMKNASGSECWALMAARTIVLINGEHSTAWNVRKRWISRLSRTSTTTCLDRGTNFFDVLRQVVHAELRLIETVLSVRPKSLAAWAHRRWVLCVS